MKHSNEVSEVHISRRSWINEGIRLSNLADPDQLLERVLGIYPEFAASHEQSVHSIYMSLLPFAHSAPLVGKQLKRLAVLLNDSVSAGGVIENAVSTCFLEHLGPSPLRKALWSLLLPATKQMTRA